jgi:hypothetical protein
MNNVERVRLADVARKIQDVRAYLADETRDYHAAFTAIDAAQRDVYSLLNWQWPPERFATITLGVIEANTITAGCIEDKDGSLRRLTDDTIRELGGHPVRMATDEGHRRTDHALPDNNDGV